jgi:hypothetical protein
MIELYIHSENGVDPKLIKTSEDATVKQLLKDLGLGSAEEGALSLFREDEAEPFDKNRTLQELEIRHRQHLHVSRCKKVRVSVFYNTEKIENFPPSTKVKKVLKWAIDEFRLTPKEAADKTLVLSSDKNNELPMDAHIGSFVAHGECSLSLALTAPVEVQG